MIILGKIKVDDHVFKYCEISYEPFYVTVMAEDEKAIVDLFNNAKSIIVMDQYGLVVKSVSNYCGVESSTIKYDFYLDEENKMKPVITVKLKAVDLNEKIKSIEAAMGDEVIDESSMSIDEFKAYKVKQYGNECQKKIYAGVDVETNYGTEHFSATGDDQANIKALSDVAMLTKVSLPYHADGSQCKVYTYQDIIKIYCEIQKLILTETSYCNALNTYVREQLYTKEEIAKINYGQEITDPTIKSNMEVVIAQGEAVMTSIAKQYLTTEPEQTEDKDTESATDSSTETNTSDTETNTDDTVEKATTTKSSKKA